MKLQIYFYPQTLSYTCDPACLMMALKYFKPKIKLNKKLEFQIWRESFGIGIPGCMPQGLAYSALIRGLKAEIICKKEKLIQISDKIATGENKKVSLFTSKEFLIKSKGLEIKDKEPNLTDIEEAIKLNKIPLVMINMLILHKIDSPHWIVVTGYDNENIFINDPYNKQGKDIVIKKEIFIQMLKDLKDYSGLDERVLIISS